MLGSGSVHRQKAHCRRQWTGSLIVAVLVLVGAGHASPQFPAAGNTTQSSSLRDVEGLIQEGNLERAKQLVDEQLAINPSNVDAYNLLGIIYTNQKDYAHATDSFQQALKLDPHSRTTHNNLGNLYVAEQKPDLAEKEFKAVLSVAPSNREANYNLGLLLLATGSPLH